jgi:hypothetical protein
VSHPSIAFVGPPYGRRGDRHTGAIDADVAVRNTSCQFGRTFVRTNRMKLCGPEKTIRGWRKTFGGLFEDVTLTMSKGKKRIRTGACGS